MWPIVDDVTCNVRKVTLLGSGPVVVGQTGNSRKRYFKFGGARLVPRKTSTETGSGKRYKIIPPTFTHGVGKPKDARLNRFVCQG